MCNDQLRGGHTTCFSAAQFLVRPRALAGIAPFDGDDQLRGNEYELPSRSSRRRDGATSGSAGAPLVPSLRRDGQGRPPTRTRVGRLGMARSMANYWHESWPSRARPKGAGKEGYNKEEHSGITCPHYDSHQIGKNAQRQQGARQEAEMAGPPPPWWRLPGSG